MDAPKKLIKSKLTLKKTRDRTIFKRKNRILPELSPKNIRRKSSVHNFKVKLASSAILD